MDELGCDSGHDEPLSTEPGCPHQIIDTSDPDIRPGPHRSCQRLCDELVERLHPTGLGHRCKAGGVRPVRQLDTGVGALAAKLDTSRCLANAGLSDCLPGTHKTT